MADAFFVDGPNQPGQPGQPGQPAHPGEAVPAGSVAGPGAVAPGSAPLTPGNPSGPGGGFNPGAAASGLNSSMGAPGHFTPAAPATPAAAPLTAPAGNPGSGPAPLGQGAFTPQSPNTLINDRWYGEEAGNLEFGQKRPRWPINKFKGMVGKLQRISVLSLEKGDWFAYPVHYLESARQYFYCFQGSCCQLSVPVTRYVIPVVNYLDLDQQGNVTSERRSLEFLSIPEKKYNDLVGISKWAPLTEIDLFVACENDQFQYITFSPVGQNGAVTKAIWKSYPQFQQEIWNDFQTAKQWMRQANAKVLGQTKQEEEAAYQRLLSAPAQGGMRGPGNAGMGGGGMRPPTSGFNPTQWNR